MHLLNERIIGYPTLEGLPIMQKKELRVSHLRGKIDLHQGKRKANSLVLKHHYEWCL